MWDDLIGFGNSLSSSVSSLFGSSGSLGGILNVLNLGAGVFGAVTKYSGQKKQASALDQSISDATAANTATAMERADQSTAQNKEKMSQRAREALAEKAKMQAIAAEQGGGVSAQRMAMMPDFALGQDVAQLEMDNASIQRQLAREISRQNATATSQRNQITRPSAFGLASDILSSGLGFANSARQMNPTSQLLQPARRPSAVGSFNPLNIG